jgi:FKBP-type peptidyl-prolyl cis-trans isomerase FklB
VVDVREKSRETRSGSGCQNMMITKSRWARFLFLAILVFPAVLSFGQSSISGIQLTYKRDPRQVDAFRGIGPWAAGPSYGGATAQDTVEVRAEGVDASGKRLKISPQWIPTDPEMVTVSPSEGDDVKIAVHRAGESKLKIAYQGFSMELVVKAQKPNNLMVFEIVPAPAPKPAMRTATEAPPSTKSKSDISYAAGMNLAKAMREQSVEVDVDSLIQGIKDGLSGGKTRMTGEEALAVLEGMYIDQRIVEESQNRKAVGEKNKREGETFMAENKAKEGVVTLPSGLQYKVIKAGAGKKPAADDVVTIQYRAMFIDGKVFDDSSKRPSGSLSFPVKSVIKGWQEALQLMPVGSRWQLFVPSDLAYGEHGAGGHGGKRAGGRQPQIGPNATLVFDVELLSVGESGAKPPASIAATDKNANPPEILEMLKKTIETESEPESEKNQ